MTVTKRTLKTIDPLTRKPKVTYLARVDLPRDPETGVRPKPLSKAFTSEREAKKQESQWKLDIARGTAVAKSGETVGSVLDSWLASKEAQPNTLANYEIVIRLHLKPTFGALPVQRLTYERIQKQYTTWRKDGLGESTHHRCHIVLSQALDHAVKSSLIYKNPVREVKQPKVERKEIHVWTRDEAVAFLSKANGDTLAPLWHLLMFTGMRRGEALGLRWQDVVLDETVARIVQTVSPDIRNGGRPTIRARTKTSAARRQIRLSSQTVAFLRAFKKKWNEKKLAAPAWEDNDLIVCTAFGTPIDPNNVGRSLDAVIKRAGVPRLRVHELRHTHATLLLASGENIKVVQERLGHRKASTTLDLYASVTADMQHGAAERFSAMLPQPPTGTTET